MSRSRKTVRLRAGLERQLRAYAVAASAGGVALLACVESADARVICGNPGLMLQGNETFPINPAKQNYPPFNLAQTWTYRESCGRSSCWTYLWNRAFFRPNTPGANDMLASNSFPAALSSGAEIGPGGHFGKGKSYGILFSYGDLGGGTFNQHKGNFGFGASGYLGYKFSIAGKDHFGWARLEAEFLQKKTTTKILAFAYETVPGKALRAGACDDLSESQLAPQDPPEPAVNRDQISNLVTPSTIPIVSRKDASLGMLALGSK